MGSNASRTARRRSRPLIDVYADRKSTRLNSSHTVISYAVFCLKKKNPAPPDAADGSPGACSAPSPLRSGDALHRVGAAASLPGAVGARGAWPVRPRARGLVRPSARLLPARREPPLPARLSRARWRTKHAGGAVRQQRRGGHAGAVYLLGRTLTRDGCPRERGPPSPLRFGAA